MLESYNFCKTICRPFEAKYWRMNSVQQSKLCSRQKLYFSLIQFLFSCKLDFLLSFRERDMYTFLPSMPASCSLPSLRWNQEMDQPMNRKHHHDSSNRN
jgi:hypothetical protein